MGRWRGGDYDGGQTQVAQLAVGTALQAEPFTGLSLSWHYKSFAGPWLAEEHVPGISETLGTYLPQLPP